MAKKTILLCSILSLALAFAAQADVCREGQKVYTSLKSEYENCIRTKAGKFKQNNPVCVEIKERMNDTQSEVRDCRMAKAVNRVMVAGIEQESIKARYKWQTGK